jgi:hypothetical protein
MKDDLWTIIGAMCRHRSPGTFRGDPVLCMCDRERLERGELPECTREECPVFAAAERILCAAILGTP